MNQLAIKQFFIYSFLLVLVLSYYKIAQAKDFTQVSYEEESQSFNVIGSYHHGHFVHS